MKVKERGGKVEREYKNRKELKRKRRKKFIKK